MFEWVLNVPLYSTSFEKTANKSICGLKCILCQLIIMSTSVDKIFVDVVKGALE